MKRDHVTKPLRAERASAVSRGPAARHASGRGAPLDPFFRRGDSASRVQSSRAPATAARRQRRRSKVCAADETGTAAAQRAWPRVVGAPKGDASLEASARRLRLEGDNRPSEVTALARTQIARAPYTLRSRALCEDAKIIGGRQPAAAARAAPATTRPPQNRTKQAGGLASKLEATLAHVCVHVRRPARPSRRARAQVYAPSSSPVCTAAVLALTIACDRTQRCAR